jgi:hypothetical protein
MKNILITHLLQFMKRVFEGQPTPEKKLVSGFQSAPLFHRETRAAQAHGVKTAHARRIAVRSKEGQHVLNYL